MDDLFLALLLISLASGLFFLVSPRLLSRVVKGEEWSRKRIAGVFGGLAVLFFVLFGVTASSVEPSESTKNSIPTKASAVEAVSDESVPENATSTKENSESEDVASQEKKNKQEEVEIQEKELTPQQTQTEKQPQPKPEQSPEPVYEPEPEPEPTSEPEPEPETEPEPATAGLWYTSSHYSAQYYYHESCDGWQGLSSSYLKSYNSEAAVRSAHPNHTRHPDCNP